MKPVTLCLALGAAQLATCAPVPGHAMSRGEEVSGREHDATPFKSWIVDNDQDDSPAPNGQSRRMQPRPEIRQLSLLRPLSRHRIPNGERQRRPRHDDMRWPHHDHHDHHEHDHFGPLDVNNAGPPQPGMPYHHGQLAQDRNDMLIVYLAAAFMIVVVVMEAWGGAFRRQGAIRLDETTSRPPASVRADADEYDRSLDEKRCA